MSEINDTEELPDGIFPINLKLIDLRNLPKHDTLGQNRFWRLQFHLQWGHMCAPPQTPPPLPPSPKGIGQVNGPYPAIWAIISTSLLNCLGEEGHGAA